MAAKLISEIHPVSSVRNERLAKSSTVGYTASCNGVVSHGAQFGSLWVFANHTRKSKGKTNAFMIYACWEVFYACDRSALYAVHVAVIRARENGFLSHMQVKFQKFL